MAKAKVKRYELIQNVLEYRDRYTESQDEFWRRLGVTQSGGSRYESGRAIPTPSAILAFLFIRDEISEEQLVAAKAALGR